ncbi:MAG: hypothetical protein AAGC96_21355 [Pseudomonadota bacterium]
MINSPVIVTSQRKHQPFGALVGNLVNLTQADREKHVELRTERGSAVC